MHSILKEIAPAASQWYYFFVIAAACYGVFVLCKRRELPSECFFILLCIFGFVMMLLLSEAQSRYKSNILPLIVIISSIGCVSLNANPLFAGTRQKENESIQEDGK